MFLPWVPVITWPATYCGCPSLSPWSGQHWHWVSAAEPFLAEAQAVRETQIYYDGNGQRIVYVCVMGVQRQHLAP